MRSAVAAVGLLLLILVPTASARMILRPHEMDLEGGYYAPVQVEIQNKGEKTFSWTLKVDGGGLFVSLERSTARMAPHTTVTQDATVRALPWSSGDHEVTFTLIEEGEIVDVQTVTVHVTPLAGLPPALLGAAAIGAVTGGLTGTLFGVALWRRWHFVVAALFTRLRRDALEGHPSRAGLLRLVRERPGITLSEAQRETGLANGPFAHHLRKLQDAGRLVVDEDGRGRRLRLPDRAPLEPAGTATEIARLVRERGELRAVDVARALGLSRQNLHYHVRKLASEGLLDARISGGRLVLAAPSPP